MEGRTHQRKTQQESKPKQIQRAKINHSPRAMSSGDQRDGITESHGSSTIEVHTINPWVRTDQFKKQRLTHQQWEDIKKQSPNERKGGSLRNNVKLKRGNSTLRY